MTLPNFLIIGAPRCGTSWLHRCLVDHPEVAMAKVKEVNFFNSYKNWSRGVEWYESFFENCESATAIGEATPGYFPSLDATERMTKVVPNAKLIAVLRNPIDRAYSMFWLGRGCGEYADLSFEQAIIEHESLLNPGLYTDHIERTLKFYPRDQLLILLFDDLKHNDADHVKKVFEFIGVDPEFSPSMLGKTFNAVLFPRTQHFLRQIRLHWFIKLLKKVRVDQPLRRLHRASGKQAYPPMAESTRDQLRQFFTEPNRRLEDLLNLKLDWS